MRSEDSKALEAYPAEEVDERLRQFGQELFEAKGSLSAFRETVYAVGDRHLQLRDELAVA